MSDRSASAWDRFWFPLVSPAALGLFRLIFGACLLAEIATTQQRSTFAIAGGFHLPYVSWLGPVSEQAYLWIHRAEYPLAACVMLGLFTRPAASLLFLLQARIFFADQLTFRNHPYFFLLVLLVLIPSPCGEAFALGAFLRRLRAKLPVDACLLGDRLHVAAFTRLLCVEVSLVYLLAAVNKIHDHYMTGAVLQHILGDALREKDFGHWLAGVVGAERLLAFIAHPAPWVLLASFTVVVELFLPVALWVPRLRRVAILIGLALHLGIAVTMNIHTFTGAMLGSYLLFLEPETVPRLTRRLLGLPRSVPETRS